ncbi:MAG: GntR family transcriptional regulator [Victivallaceae bacterium]|nr:GntR family transcriptional regulator [Victivallaceae bacterium]
MTAFEANTALPLQQQIADHLARRIISGELADGERLPPTLELAKIYRVTPVTIHKSLQSLVQRQLIERVPRRGTFVRSRERVNVIALAFGSNPFSDQSMFYLRLMGEFQQQAEKRNSNLKIYFDFENSNRAIFDLEQDLARGEVKAIIASRRSLRLTEFLNERLQNVLWCDPFLLDFQETVRKGVAYLAQQGYRKILVVSMYPEELVYEEHKKNFQAEVRGAALGVANTSAEVSVVRWGDSEIDGYERGKEFCRSPNRPDAILVNHDVICRGLLLALVEHGIKIPRDIGVISYINKGCEFISPVKLTALLQDPERIACRCLDTLEEAIQTGTKGRVFAPPSDVVLSPGVSCGENGEARSSP